MSTWKILSAGALALATAIAPAQAAPAGQLVAPLAAQSSDGNGVTEVRHRHRHWRHRHRGNIGVGIGLGIIGGMIAAEAYRSNAYGYEGGDPRVACAQRFRSFEWNTGLYTTYEGDRVVCPYLR